MRGARGERTASFSSDLPYPPVVKKTLPPSSPEKPMLHCQGVLLLGRCSESSRGKRAELSDIQMVWSYLPSAIRNEASQPSPPVKISPFSAPEKTQETMGIGMRDGTPALFPSNGLSSVRLIRQLGKWSEQK